MPISSNDILNVAISLDQAPDEASKRSSVSRSYYASFHSTASAFPEGVKPSSQTSHDDLLGAVDRYAKTAGPKGLKGGETAKQLHNTLKSLKKMRKNADYELHTPFEDRNSTNAAAKAKEVIKLATKVYQIRNTPPPEEITA